MKKINIKRPSIKRKDLEYVLNSMIKDSIDYGEFANSFEKKLSDKLSMKNSLVVNSIYSAFSIVLESLNIKEGDEIILPSFLPQVYLNVIISKKAVPVLVDLEKDFFQPSIESVREAITDKTKALLLFYYFGYCYDPSPYLDLCPTIIEDISSVIGADYGDYPIGKTGKYSISNFSVRNIITTGDGASVFTNNRNLFSTLLKKVEKDYNPDYTLRIRCLMPDLNAAMGISQLETLKRRIKIRNKIGKIYEDSIRRSKNSFVVQEVVERFYSDFPIVIKSGLKNAIDFFKKYHIELIKPFPFPLHHYLNYDKNSFPNTEYFYLHTLLVPIYSSLLNKDVENISKVLSSMI